MSKVVEDYILMEPVGKGQYGNVYRAEHRLTHQLFAVKVMGLEKIKQTPKLNQFIKNEITILTRINHPNIIRFIQMLRTNNNYYLVYEYCNGGTLADYIKAKKRLPQDEAIKLFTQLRSAFQLLNREKILHRDLKPSNILFHNGVLLVADFGFCKQNLDGIVHKTMVGSPIYMAPEVLKGGVYDNRADIWSLGVIFYEMLYGVCPYEQATISKLIQLIDNTLLKFPPEIPVSHHIQVLLKRMMTTKFRERINAEQLIKYPLQVKETQYALKSHKSIEFQNLRDVLIFNRKMMTYMSQTLNDLALKMDVDRQKFSQSSFFVYKILLEVLKTTFKNQLYWKFIKIANNDDQWDLILKNEIQILEPFGPMIKQIIIQNGANNKMKMEIQSSFVNFKHYLQIASLFNTDLVTKQKLLNCLLIMRHYVFVLEKKSIDFTDFTQNKISLQEKQDICKKLAFTRT